MLGDLQSKRAILAKGFLFLAMGVIAVAIIAMETRSWRVVAMTLLAVWAFCRFYYFMFYVIEKYVDPSFKFASLTDFVIYMLKRRKP
jgi:hypothetical protein